MQRPVWCVSGEMLHVRTQALPMGLSIVAYVTFDGREKIQTENYKKAIAWSKILGSFAHVISERFLRTGRQGRPLGLLRVLGLFSFVPPECKIVEYDAVL